MDIIKSKHLDFVQQSIIPVQLYSKKVRRFIGTKVSCTCFLKHTLNGHLHVEYGVMKERKLTKDKPCFKAISNDNISFRVSVDHSVCLRLLCDKIGILK